MENLPENKENTFHDVKNIHQIMISEKNEVDFPRKGVIYDNMQAVRKIYSSAQYKLWNSKEIEQFLEVHFPVDVLFSYKKMLPFAYKADLARYCILYIHGGIYVDLGIRFMNEWKIPIDKGFATFKEISFPSDSWTTMQNGLIWSLPKRRELFYCIQYIIENCSKEFYGKSPLYITGPIMFGRAVAAAMVENMQSSLADDQFIGEYRWTTPEHGIKNDAYVAPDHSLIAFRTKHTAGDLTHLGIKGTNNYNVIWRNGKVYGEKGYFFSFKRFGNVFDDRLKTSFEREVKGLRVEASSETLISFGPYLPFSKGSYRLCLIVSGEYEGNINVAVTLFGGKETVHIKKLEGYCHNLGEGETVYSAFEFSLDTNVNLLEVVLKSSEGFLGTIVGYKIVPIESNMVDFVEYKKWSSTSPNIKTVVGKKEGVALAFLSEQVGRVSYGPYVKLEEGSYILKIFLMEKISLRKIFLEVACNSGTNVLKTFRFMRIAKSDVIVCPFHLEQSFDDIEFRFHTRGGVYGAIKYFDLYKENKRK